MKLHPQAVIFDMDGVIVDSMPYHFIAWHEALRPYGARVSCFDVFTKEGERWERSLEDFLRRAGITPTPRILNKIFLERKRIFKRYFKRFIFKGAGEFLRCLKKRGYSLGVVTGTPLEELNKILPRSIRELFEVVVTGDSVKKGKPHPEPYLKAASVLGLRPKQCLVVENAPFGIASAKKAGMFCIAITTSLPRDYLKQADIIVDRLEDITGLIDKTCSLK